MAKTTKLDLSALGMLLVSGLGIFTLLTATAGLTFTGLLALAAGGVSGEQALPFFSLAWAALLFSVLLAPALANAVIRLLNIDRPLLGIPHNLRLASVMMLFFPALVVFGDFISLHTRLTWFFLPPVQILVTVIPIIWIVEVGGSGLQMSGRRREWNLVGFNLTINQPFILAVEMLLLIILGSLAFLWLAGRPELVSELQRLAQRIIDAGMDPALIQRLIAPYLQQPAVILGSLIVIAGIIPLLEELLKPLALWGLAGRSFTPVDGFIGGMLCGATFALMETLGNLTNPVELWGAVVVGRFGTALLHITTSGLVGWGLASALSEGRYMRLGAIYLVSVSLHSLWNVFGVTMGFAPLINGNATSGFIRLSERLGSIAPAAMVVLAILLSFILVGSNRRLRMMSALLPQPGAERPEAAEASAADDANEPR